MHVSAYLLACLRFVKNITDSAQLDQEHREAEVKAQQAKRHSSYLKCQMHGVKEEYNFAEFIPFYIYRPYSGTQPCVVELHL